MTAPLTGEAKPIRIQRKRTAGWRMPKGAVYVGRGSKWGNRYYVVNEDGANLWIADAITNELLDVIPDDADPIQYLVEYWKKRCLDALPDISELRGKNLACWCSLDAECHADILLELSNSEPPKETQP